MCEIFLPLLSVLLLALFATTYFLPGAHEGFRQFLIPDFSKIWDADIWLASFGHVFFSLSVALGLIVGYSRYTGEDVHIVRSMVWVAFGDLATSFVSGLVIFGGIGYMANYLGKPFAEVVTSSTFGLGFVVLPQICQTFPGYLGQVFSLVFFFCLAVAGLSGSFSIVEAIVGNFEVEFQWSRDKACRVAVSLMLGLALCFSWGNGPELIGAVDGMTSGVNVLLSGLSQIIVFLYLSKQIASCGEWFWAKGQRAFYYYTLKYISPLILLAVLGSTIFNDLERELDLTKVVRWVWFLLALMLATYLSRKRPTPALGKADVLYEADL